jgi:hypothetical protein
LLKLPSPNSNGHPTSAIAALAKTRASFDDPNLVSQTGLVPVMALAERAGLAALVAAHVQPGGECGANAHLKVACLVAGMAAGADSIDDMGLLRRGAMPALSGGIRAPSTLGSHLRAYTWGNVSLLEKAGREFLAELARRAPLPPGADTLAVIDSMQKRGGYQKQGAKFGHTKIGGKSHNRRAAGRPRPDSPQETPRAEIRPETTQGHGKVVN